MPLKQAHWSNRLIEEVDFDYAIEAGSQVEQAHRRGRLRQRHCSRLTGVYAIEAGSLTEQARRRGQSLNAPLKQAH